MTTPFWAASNPASALRLWTGPDSALRKQPKSIRSKRESLKFVKLLAGRKTAAPGDAYALLEKAPLDLVAFTLAESSNGKALGKIKNYMHKWRPLRQALPSVELELEQIGLAPRPEV